MSRIDQNPEVVNNLIKENQSGCAKLPKIFITGASGLLGSNLLFYFKDRADVAGQYFRHAVSISGVKTLCLNLCDYNATRKAMCDFMPDIIIHCASRTDVDAMEDDKEGAWQANVMTTRVLLDAVRDMKTRIIYISTESVYHGKKGPYAEHHPANPCNVYGKTKFESEKLVSQRKGSLLLRTNIFGWNVFEKKSLAEWFLGRLQNSQVTNGFSDYICSSIYTMEFAGILEKCITKQLEGVYNLASSNSCSKFEFGKNLAEVFDLDGSLIQPCKMAQSGFRAKRGNDFTLDISKIETALDLKLPKIRDSLNVFFKDWGHQLPGEIKKLKLSMRYENVYPLRNIIPYGGQVIFNEDINAVTDVLKSPNLTRGPFVDQFEAKLSKLTGANFSVAVSSGTAALHIACLASGVKSGDEVITSPVTFVASANCCIYCGAKPVFVDIDPLTYNMSPSELAAKITKRTRAVIPVHFAGQSCDMENILSVVKAAEKKFGRKIYIIEDACHALGSKYKNRVVGSCTYSDMAVMSFHPVKHVTTAEGGVVFTNDHDLNLTLKKSRSHGITDNADEFEDLESAFQYDHGSRRKEKNPWYYEQQSLGNNYRLTDIQCGLGASQLKRVEEFKVRRREIVDEYNNAFEKLDNIITPYESEDCESNFHLYVLQFEFKQIKFSRRQIILYLREKGIQTQVHYIPVHTQPYFRKLFNTGWGDFPKAESYYQKCLSIPLFPGMSDFDVNKVIDAIKAIDRGDIIIDD